MFDGRLRKSVTRSVTSELKHTYSQGRHEPKSGYYNLSHGIF